MPAIITDKFRIHNSEQFQEASGKPESGPSSWAPSTSLLTVSVVPQYSRRDVSKFDMKSFVKGEYGSGDTGFI